MARDRRLKAKNIERLRELLLKHPGDLSVEEEKELKKLQALSERYGEVQVNG